VISINREFFAKAKRLVTEEEDVQTLTRLGLTISQAKVYLALLELGKATGKTVAKHSKVARQEAYRILAELQEKGLVEKIIDMPTEFKPIPIEDCIPILIKRKKNEISETQKEATRLLQKLKQKNSKSTFQEEDETRFSLFSEQVAVRREKGTLKAVQRSFDVITSRRDPHSVIFIDMEEIAEALQRGVKIRVIIDKPAEEEVLSDIIKQLKKYSTFKIRYLPNAPKALMSIYDEKEAWVCTCTHPVLKECSTLRTNNPCLLSILQDYFETMWLTAMKSTHQNPPQT
jgi:sugar-specific transcriptional regulator TrmB